MGLLISINGANFEPYQRVKRDSPLVSGPRVANAVQPVQRNLGQSENFKDSLNSSTQRAIDTYSEVAGDKDKVSRIAVTAKDLMSSPVISLEVDQDVQKARELFEKHEIRHLPIVDHKGRLKGILSDRDLIFKKSKNLIEEVMVKEVIAGQAETRLQEIAEVMVVHRIHSVPILDETLRPIGIVTATDLLESVFKNPNVDLFI